MNKIVLVGRLTRDTELRYIAGSGTAVANFTLAVDREYTGQDGKRGTDFIDIQVWGKSAENCANYIGKGSLVSVSGSLRIDSYQAQDGTNRRSTRVNAERVQFLDSKKPQGNTSNNEVFVPSFEPDAGFFADNFEHITDGDDLPF